MDWYDKNFLDYCDKTTKVRSFSDSELLLFLRTGVNVIRYLKIEKNVHLHNIKPNNIFMDNDGNFKFSDFGMAK